jgi:DNA repair protein RadA/Sms
MRRADRVAAALARGVPCTRAAWPALHVRPNPVHRLLSTRGGRKRAKDAWQCMECGATAIKWAGRCTACGAEASLGQVPETSLTPGGLSSGMEPVGLAGFLSGHDAVAGGGTDARFCAALGRPDLREFDVVMGGGILPGSLVLLGGEPGVGKTTLLLQVAEAVAVSLNVPKPTGRGRVLYASGEETVSQIAEKAKRLFGSGIHYSVWPVQMGGPLTGGVTACAVCGVRRGGAGMASALDVVCETSIENLEALVAANNYALVIVDSVQTCTVADSSSLAGSPSQLRMVAARLMQIAKREEVALLLAGHVTKEGAIAGPRLLEHLVDVVLYFEGSEAVSATGFRVLRCHKNRFGPTHELGVFSMGREGLASADEMLSTGGATAAEREGESAARGWWCSERVHLSSTYTAVYTAVYTHTVWVYTAVYTAV